MSGFKGQTTDLANVYPEPDQVQPQAPSPAPPAPPATGPVRRSNHVRNTVNGQYLRGDRKR